MSKRILTIMLAGGLAIGAESSAVGAGNACAPDESAATAEFFAKYVDCTIPALREIPAKMAAGDEAGAKRLFADYIRATLDPRWFEANGQEASLTKEGKANLKRQAKAIMDAYPDCVAGHTLKKALGYVDLDKLADVESTRAELRHWLETV